MKKDRLFSDPISLLIRHKANLRALVITIHEFYFYISSDNDDSADRSDFTTALRAHGKALTPEAAAAGWREGADAVCLVLFQQLAASAEQAGSILEFVDAPTEGTVFFTVPDLAETLLPDVSEGVVPDSAFVVAQISVCCVEQTHAGRDVPVPADEAMPLLNKTTPVGTPGDGLSLPREQLRLLQALLVWEKKTFVSFREPEHGNCGSHFKALKAPGIADFVGHGFDRGHVAHGPERLPDVRCAVGNDMTEVQIIGPDALGKFPDAAKACDVIAHDDSRHAETDVRSLPHLVEAFQISENQTEIAADLYFTVIFIQLVNGEPDSRNARLQKRSGLLLRQQRPVGDQFHFFPVRRSKGSHLRQCGMHQRLPHAAEEDGFCSGQNRIVHHARENRRFQIAEALADPTVPEAHLAPEIAAGGNLYIQFSNPFFRIHFDRAAA